MQRHVLLAALAALASTSALAQSSVTVYGRLNASVEHIKADNGDKTWRLINNASRLGFRGVEDLGGGMNAGFQFEHGFNVDDGASTAGNSFWFRQSEVNLGSTSFGKVRLGNYFSDAYYATADYVSLHNHDTGTSADALYAYVGLLGGFNSNTNKIGYRSPSIAGLVVNASVSLGENLPGRERAYDLAADYTIGNLHLGAGFEKHDESRQFAISALYTMGAFTAGGYVQRDKNGFGDDLGDRTTVRLVGMFTVGASEFHVNVGRAGEYDNLDNSDATQWTLGYNHNLSKRTKLFAFVTKLNDDQGVYGGDLRSVALGVRHNF